MNLAAGFGVAVRECGVLEAKPAGYTLSKVEVAAVVDDPPAYSPSPPPTNATPTGARALYRRDLDLLGRAGPAVRLGTSAAKSLRPPAPHYPLCFAASHPTGGPELLRLDAPGDDRSRDVPAADGLPRSVAPGGRGRIPGRGGQELDVEGLLDFADEVLADATQIWVEAGPDSKRRFEQALYPDGVVYDPAEAFRTVPAPLVFRSLQLEERGKSRLVEQVTQSSRDSNSLLTWLREVAALRQIAA